MTTDTVGRLHEPQSGSQPGFASPVVAIAVLAGTHFLVDLFSGTVNPLWQSFESRFAMADGGLLWVVFVWYAANSVTQVAFGWWADRGHRQWLIWAGALTGVVCLGGIGLAGSQWWLAGLVLLGGLGIASFHPEGAATAGAIAPSHRSRIMAIFALCGYLGQSVGPLYSSRWTSRFGLPALAAGGLLGVALLTLLFTQRRHLPSLAGTVGGYGDVDRPPLPLGRAALLLAIGALRITPAVGAPLVLAYWLSDREQIGNLQSVFMAGIGSGSILCAIGIGPRLERPVLWLFPLLAVPCLLAIPRTDGGWLMAAVGVAGVVLGVAMPVFISYGQQMLPHHARAASSITMGASWGLASAASWSVVWLCKNLDQLDVGDAFLPLAATSAAAGLLSLTLPHLAPS
ncbi:MAG: MFS transporter [Planctomycetota bacterium]|nr:MAG: MFS transporter [Planctomycetota bacterium]REK30742.1 MAG: MFS transporter [Planctomycetota bacterium]REK33117.1 MAG: MFS transporter [Planctomycetota bacterium]